MTFRVKKTANFCQISNEALRDTRLSYCARGILAMVMTHSDEWNTSTDWLRENTRSEGKVAIGNAIKELKAAGYLKITPLYTDGRFNGHVWSWSDAPQSDEEQNSRNRDFCNEESCKRDCIPEHQATEHQEEEEKTVAAEAAPPPPEELRSLKAKPHSPTPSSAPAPSHCPWHLTLGVSLPESLRTQNCLEAAKLWLQHKREKNQKYSTVGFRQMVAKWGNVYNPITFVRAVEHSVESAYAGVHPHPDDKGKRNSGPAPAYDDPFHGMPVVTMADIIAKFGNGQDCVKWANRMRAAGRMR